jgi:hypothetical protein
VTIDDGPICCEAPRQAVERPQEATWPGQERAGGPEPEVSPAGRARWWRWYREDRIMTFAIVTLAVVAAVLAVEVTWLVLFPSVPLSLM